MRKAIYYHSIPAEIKKLGITQKECAELLGCSLSGLTHRIAANKQQLHWAIYGVSNYLGTVDNLQRDVE